MTTNYVFLIVVKHQNLTPACGVFGPNFMLLVETWCFKLKPNFQRNLGTKSRRSRSAISARDPWQTFNVGGQLVSKFPSYSHVTQTWPQATSLKEIISCRFNLSAAFCTKLDKNPFFFPSLCSFFINFLADDLFRVARRPARALSKSGRAIISTSRRTLNCSTGRGCRVGGEGVGSDPRQF